MLCRHCGRVPPSRPRGLCWSCYYSPGVRDLHPSTSKFARRGVGNFKDPVQELPLPTGARPGSQEKVTVLEQRVLRRQALWHPDDEPMDAESRRLGFR